MVVVELRMLARPLLMCCSPHAIAAQGNSALVNAMMTKGPMRARQSALTSGRRIAAMITPRATVPDTERTRTRAVGLMSWTPSLIRRNDAPQIRLSAAKARYGRSGCFDSDTRHPVVGREDQRDWPI